MIYDKTTLKCCGIYAIVNTQTHRTYIGLTRDSFRSRWWMHTGNLNRGDHPCAALQRDWVSFGPGAFDFRILEVIPKRFRSDYVKAREWYHIKQSPSILYNTQMPGMRVRGTNDVDDIISRVPATAD